MRTSLPLCRTLAVVATVSLAAHLAAAAERFRLEVPGDAAKRSVAVIDGDPATGWGDAGGGPGRNLARQGRAHGIDDRHRHLLVARDPLQHRRGECAFGHAVAVGQRRLRGSPLAQCLAQREIARAGR